MNIAATGVWFSGHRSSCWDVGTCAVLFLLCQLFSFSQNLAYLLCLMGALWFGLGGHLTCGCGREHRTRQNLSADGTDSLVLPLQFFIVFHSLLLGTFGGLACSIKTTPRIEVIHFMALSVFPTTCTLSASLCRHNCRSAQRCLCFIPAPPHTGSHSCLCIVAIWESTFHRISSGNSVQEMYTKSRAK